MKLTPKQLKEKRRRRQRAKELAELPPVGPSLELWDKIQSSMAMYDELDEEVAALVTEYGFDRAMRAVRQYYGRWEQARAFLESERRRNEEVRWRNGGVLPSGM